jgi:hypothetical protein
VPVHRLANTLFAAEIDLRFGNHRALCRWGDGRGYHRAESGSNSGDIGFRHREQATLQGHHIVAEQTAERRV